MLFTRKSLVRMKPSPLTEARSAQPWTSLSLLAFLMVFIGLSVRTAITTPLWMDEVMSAWLIRMPSVSTIYWALLHTGQTDPPGFAVLLHFYARIAGTSNLALRLPSILAELLTGVFAFFLLRRHLGVPAAQFAGCLVLLSLSPFGLQVRPYALSTVCFAGALLLWDGLRNGHSWWRAVGIAFLLSCAASLHFYSVLYVPCFALIELIHSLRTRTLRIPVWFALTAAGASVFFWLPLIHAGSNFTAEIVRHSRHYTPKPSLDLLILTYPFLFQGLGNLPGLGSLGMLGAIILTTLGLMGLVAIFQSVRSDPREGSQPNAPLQKQEPEFWTITLGVLLLPLIVFLFSCAVTGAYKFRHILAASIGAAALITDILAGFPTFRRALPASYLVISAFLMLWGPPAIGVFDHSSIFSAMPGTAPIVLADANEFFQLEYASPAAFRSRLVYLTLPPDYLANDATDAYSVLSWKSIDPSLPVESSLSFLQKNTQFYVLDEQAGDDTPAIYLLRNHRIQPWQTVSTARIYQSTPVEASVPPHP